MDPFPPITHVAVTVSDLVKVANWLMGVEYEEVEE